jgi:hypothetical protein
VLVTVTGWYPTKRLMHCGHLLICCASPSWVQSFLIHPPDLSGKYQQRHLVVKQGETWRVMSANLAGEVCLSYRAGIFKILRHGADDFTFRRKSCDGFLSPLKIHHPRTGLALPYVQSQAQLPLYHRERQAGVVTVAQWHCRLEWNVYESGLW